MRFERSPMAIEVFSVGAGNEAAYADVIARSDHAMLYHGLKYRNFLRSLIPVAHDGYLVAFEDGIPTAALPATSH